MFFGGHSVDIDK